MITPAELREMVAGDAELLRELEEQVIQQVKDSWDGVTAKAQLGGMANRVLAQLRRRIEQAGWKVTVRAARGDTDATYLTLTDAQEVPVS